MTAPAVRLSGITKRFGPVVANDAVDLEIPAGTIHGIIGENGAGKSTLVSVLYGFHRADEGRIEIDGRPAEIRDSADAIALGIGMVHQHFMLVPNFTVLENVMLGAEGGWRLAGGARGARAALARLGAEHGLEIDPEAEVGGLAVGLQQRVEILKALFRGARILILDEPTGVLTPEETTRFFGLLATLKARGVTVLLITHKLGEVMAATDGVSVMRGGRMVAHRVTAETGPEELARLMMGRDIAAPARPAASAPGTAPALEARGLGWRDRRGVACLEAVDLALRPGEILGLAGVAGNGQSELLDLLAGLMPPQAGEIRIGARRITAADPADPAEMRRLGLAHVPEDRHRRGLVLAMEAAENAVLGYHHGPQAGPPGRLSPAAMRAHCARLMARHGVRPEAPSLRAAAFSGGNQQRLVMGREIEADPAVLLIGQPTRGVDIGGIAALHEQILGLRAKGCAILLVSVELDEILALSDRVAVMAAGRIVAEFPCAEATRERIGLAMAGIPETPGAAAAMAGPGAAGPAGGGGGGPGPADPRH
ncbi:ABC transporter ATP-binding protein [Paralimibaculum aggregatum]|uniref:ABC transporter ATP-binding protein n=1 Tax=Paralimibaculum aggregatum TaxID=3036245 RepID=A0ABQ6LKJ0_9RHOB|nr:ABC transporter ATP-binding protein [Limibaculum sp. NKW23]GMG81164.1 ABC transporter ATP-binding protein [Limibaculum sp. NKW23]